MARYKVKYTSILHNGKLYPEGKTINLKEEDAIKLAEFIELIPEATQSNASPNNSTKQVEPTKSNNADTNNSKGGNRDGEQ